MLLSWPRMPASWGSGVSTRVCSKPRLFAELDAASDDASVVVEYAGALMPSYPWCMECGQSTPVPGWHVDPGTGEYVCH